jgi:cytochrome oxidase Cu insertion factor (SCO1/SenC/PrrC family)
MTQSKTSDRRLLIILLASLALLVVAVGLMWTLLSERRPSALVGTVLDPPDQAADFSLTDQTGATFTLSEARGRVVVLTFLYTHCTDVCPFVAAKLKAADDQLGEDAGKVVLVAITTDPERDNLNTVAAYSRRLGLYDRWHFLVGPQSDLEPLWQAYAVAAQVDNPTDLPPEQPRPVAPATLQALGLDNGLDAAEVALAQGVIGAFGGGYHVTHSTPIWLIDPQGRLRVLLRQSASPDDIVQDVRALLP